MENAEAPRPPDSGSTASSSASQSSSSRQPGQRAASLATLGAVGAVTYLLFTGRLTAPWYGILSFYGAAVLPGDVVLGLGMAALNRLLPSRRPDGK